VVVGWPPLALIGSYELLHLADTVDLRNLTLQTRCRRSLWLAR